MLRPYLKYTVCLLFVSLLVLSGCGLFSSPPPPTFPTAVAPISTLTTAPLPATLSAVATEEPIVVPTGRSLRDDGPTPTHDVARDEWTILIYMDGDNNLEQAALRDIDEMESAFETEGVNVLIQLDRRADPNDNEDEWSNTRRYLIRPDGGAEGINSELLFELDEVNMGSPEALVDFVSWGMQSRPANRYALILWDHGAGWFGTTYDEDAPGSAGTDRLTMPELNAALGDALATVGEQRIDVIGFDGCLMGQLDVLEAIYPHADYAVGSQELIPGRGWDYEALLNGLNQDPVASPIKFATQAVDDFAAYYQTESPNDFVTMSAVDLARVADVSSAVELLGVTLLGNPAFTASAVADARAGAEAYARYYRDEFEYYGSIDLWHFASLLTQRSLDDQVTGAAEKILLNVESAVIHAVHGTGFRQAHGISLYFPRTAEFYASTYTTQTNLTVWNTFMQAYYETNNAALADPEITLLNEVTQVVSMQNPAYLGFEITGRGVEDVSLMAGIFDEQGRRRLLEYDPLVPEPAVLADGSLLETWRDGVHEDFFVWQPQVTFLSDGTVGDYVVMWPTYEGSRWIVSGRYRSSLTNDEVDAYLVFDTDTRQLDSVWGYQVSEGEQSPYELVPLAGDLFQIANLYLQSDGAIVFEAGETLTLGTEGGLNYSWQAVPSGDYFLGFQVENTAGNKVQTFTEFVVDNNSLVEGFEAYRDPYIGFQFFYPDNWVTPTYDSEFCRSDINVLCAADPNGDSWLYVYVYPQLNSGAGAETLREQTLRDFGNIAVRYEDEITLQSGGSVERVAYSYATSDGERTGIFMAFVIDEIGYVVDLDSRSLSPEALITLSTTVVESWQTFAHGFGLSVGKWATLNEVACTVAYPAGYTFRESSNWCIFNGGGGNFMALRTDPHVAGENYASVLERWLATTNDQPAFEQGRPYFMAIDGIAWQRVDFSWQADDGSIVNGFIMAAFVGGEWMVAWGEAPSGEFARVDRTIFQLMVADFSQR